MADKNIEAEEELKFARHPDDTANFLKLSRALRMLIKHSLSNDDINNADTLLREYCTELITVRITAIMYTKNV